MWGAFIEMKAINKEGGQMVFLGIFFYFPKHVEKININFN